MASGGDDLEHWALRCMFRVLSVGCFAYRCEWKKLDGAQKGKQGKKSMSVAVRSQPYSLTDGNDDGTTRH